MRFAVWLAWLVVGAGSLTAQEAAYTFRNETHLVVSTVSVHDAQGGLVQGLTRDDFNVVEDGVPQTIKFFAPATQLPLSIGLIIDASGSQVKFVKAHEKDIQTFLGEVLEPQDEAFALCFGNHLRLVSDYSHTGDAIMDGLRRFDKGDRNFPEMHADERELGTALYDAVWFGIDEKMRERATRRKVMLVLSDGEENSSEHDLLDVIEAAQNANVVVYAVRYTEHNHNRWNARDRYGVRVLDHMTAQTGGRVYDVETTKMREAFAEIAGEIRALYEVAYQSTNRTRDGAFRKVVIGPAKDGLVMRSRSGYYAVR